MNELKPEDVMGALECCADDFQTCSVKKCPMVNVWFCRNILAENALALLREKDAEIERLKEHQDTVTIVCERAKEHYHNLYENAKELFKETARAEAITEFAERLKNALNNVARWSMHGVEGEYFIIGKPLIDKIAKEMKGETDERSD